MARFARVSSGPRLVARLLFALAVGVSGVLVATASPSERAERGFTFRIAALNDIESLDPALAALGEGPVARLQTEIARATCSTLYVIPSSAKPLGLVGALPVPEAAAAPPRISRDGRIYTIVVRRGLRFSDGSPIDARNFARAYERLRSKDVVERSNLLRGIARVRARGRTLRIALRAASGDLPARLAESPFCPVPRGTPLARVDTVPGSGPYYVAERVPNERIVLRRNRYYGGSRTRRPAAIVVGIGRTASSNIRAAQAGTIDLVHDEPTGQELDDVGIDHDRLQRSPVGWTVYFALNNARPLFRNNPRLRRAVNYAIDRGALERAFRRPHFATDQTLPPGVPGFEDAKLYPLAKPNVRRARQLARGNLRGGRAIMYVSPEGLRLGVAQIVQSSLREIGLEVEFKLYAQAVINVRIASPSEPFDIAPTARMIWSPHDVRYVDPIWFLQSVDGRARRPATNVSNFDVPRVNRLLAAANRLQGVDRLRAFGRLDAEIMRRYAPFLPVWVQPRSFYAGPRVGCFRFVLDVLDYGAVCAKR